MSLDNFILGKILGKGSYGSVRIVERKEDHKIYAMKSVVINVLTEKEQLNSFNEVRLLASLKHQNIIDYKESFFDEISKTLYIVMEYADDGDLKSKISEILKKHLFFEESTIWNVLIQTLEGLKYLHKNNIIHRDLKSANIFLTKNGFIKIGDLNVSTIAKKGVASTQTGTPYYASPEIWNDKPYNSKCDIWSLGCIIYEMANLHVPFRGTSLQQLYSKIMKGIYPQISIKYSNDLKNIIRIILNVDAQKRPSAEELLKNEIILKKIKEFGIYKNNENKIYEKAMLIKTIKIPKNISLINKQLPQKRYELKQKKNKEDMFNNDEYEYSKSFFNKISNQKNNKNDNGQINKFDDLHKLNLGNKIEPYKYNNININDIIITTNDTDRINIPTKEENGKNDNLKNYIIYQNIENYNLLNQKNLQKPYKDTRYNFFLGNKNNHKNINNNNNKFLINKKHLNENQNKPKQKANTGSPIKNINKEKRLPNIRPKSTRDEKNDLKYNKLNKNNHINGKERKNNICSVKVNDINNINKKNNRKNSCVSANKKAQKNINRLYPEKELNINNKNNKLKRINKGKQLYKNNKINNNDERVNKNKYQINYNKSPIKQKQRPISTGNYNIRNYNKEHKFQNLTKENKIDKSKINAKIHYNQLYKKENENLNNKEHNKFSPNKHKIIYERIEIVKNGKKNQYNRGKPLVKYIDIGNHYSQYKNIKNTIYNLRAKNNYQIMECGKGANFIIPNKMMEMMC